MTIRRMLERAVVCLSLFAGALLIVVWWTPIVAWVADTVQHVWPW